MNNGWAWDRKKLEILERDGYRCYLCGGRAVTVDHILNRARGGTDCDDNLAAICVACHRRKTAREAARGRAEGVGRSDPYHPLALGPPPPSRVRAREMRGGGLVEKRACGMCPRLLTKRATGRPPRYCGLRCRRRAEYARRRWNRAVARVQWAEANAALDGRTPGQRTNWLDLAQEISTALGPRP